jgi:DNA polymerase elongation subunit (family B)
MWGVPCKKFATNSRSKFEREYAILNAKFKTHESDINPVFRCLENNYLGSEIPDLHIAFLDIEVDFDPSRGYADPWDPFARITAISVFRSQTGTLHTLVLKPDVDPTESYYLTDEQAKEITDKFENTVLCADEPELLSRFLELIRDSDVLSGWNSTYYDLPYLVNRVERILGKHAIADFCLWNKAPKRRDFTKFKRKSSTYDLFGRVHLDYLELYQKHNTQQLHTYRLDHVGEIEVGENKVPYAGSLDTLYKQDFEKFIAYNRQDTLLLRKIDAKRKFISLACQVAHNNTVLLKTTLGSVAVTEQGIINECHARGMVAPNKKRSSRDKQTNFDDQDDYDSDEAGDNGPAVGAYVAEPKVGKTGFNIGADMSSLYPSTLRALNMGPETLVGQIRCTVTEEHIKKTKSWDDMFGVKEFEMIHNQTSDILTIDWNDGRTEQMAAAEIYHFLFVERQPLSLSANGTFFRTDTDGVVPGLLGKWYSRRKQLQAKAAIFKELINGIAVSSELDEKINNLGRVDQPAEIENLKLYIKENQVAAIKSLQQQLNLVVENGTISCPDKNYAKSQAAFWDQRQYALKIDLNALYGSILNQHCRFYDFNIGQSTTLSGRRVVKHLMAKGNEGITGRYDVAGDAVIYGDTDSVYLTPQPFIDNHPEAKEFLSTRENFILYADQLVEFINVSFPSYMNDTFNTGIERGSIMKAARELVGSSGLFITKKRYAILMYDKEGVRLDVGNSPGKIKAMGLDLKRADTPKQMQQFLERILMNVLCDAPEAEVLQTIKEFRQTFRDLPSWQKGTPKKANSVIEYTNKLKADRSFDFANPRSIPTKKINTTIPGHVQASINWNRLRQINNDRYSIEIQDGQKVIVCKLKPKNELQMTSIAYPIDELHLPDWFKKLPFDDELMEETIIDKKIENLLGVLNWNLKASKISNHVSDLFSF